MELNFEIPFAIPHLPHHGFVGRDQELHDLRASLKVPEGTAQTKTVFYALIGTGGMGKTHLAIEYAYRYSKEYSAVFWINGASEMDANASFYDMARVIVREQAKCSVTPTPNYGEIALRLDLVGVLRSDGTLDNLNNSEKINQAVKCWLSLPKSTRWLLIFDNVDDLESFRIDSFFPGTCNGSIIITSRRQEVSRLARPAYVEGLDPEAANDLLLTLAGEETTPQC